MYPALVFDYYDFFGMARDEVDPATFVERMERDRKAVRDAVSYGWDNAHFHLSDAFGHVNCVFSIYENYRMDGPYGPNQKKIHINWMFDVWADMGVAHIGHKLFTKFDEILPWLWELLEHTHKHEYFCQKCGTWSSQEDTRRYSFAGIVCAKCYDPQVHLPPDTRGD